MTKRELTRQIEMISGSPLINLSEIARMFRMSRDRAADMMRGCRVEQRGRGKYFFVEDVAEQYMNRTVMY